MELGEWLRRLGLSQYERAFVDNAIDAEVLAKLTVEDLKELGVTLVGHRRKLLDAIAALPGDTITVPASPAPSLTAPAGEAPRPSLAERRQLTILFYDLVGSTALSTQLDPEELREFVGAYHRSVTEAITRFGGFVAHYMGDGGLVYFGYPRADENDAERAILAALAAVEAVGKLAPFGGAAPQIRIGIATGLVVVGDIVGTGDQPESDVAGEAPNLAARLQVLAGPNGIVIAASTKRLVGDGFEYERITKLSLKGFDDPIEAYRVLRAGVGRSRFEGRRPDMVVPLVGRDEEIDLLLRRWERAKAGQGQVVFLSGEPGIGKSRLARALLQRVAGERHFHMWYFCSPYHQNSALYPVLVQIEHAAGFERDDTPEAKLEKLGRLFPHAGPQSSDIALIADLLRLPVTGQHSPTQLPGARRRQLILDTLLRNFEVLAAAQPVLMFLEDAQWIDPTTRELVDLMIDRMPRKRALLVVTCRPEFQLPWTGQPDTTVLALGRLARENCRELIGQVIGARLLGDDVLGEIIDRTDGVPLFLEEMTRSVVERDIQTDRVGSQGRQTRSVDLPFSLHTSLMARLDRIPAALPIAQLGATIGREFSYEMLKAVAGLPEADLVEGLAQLGESGLVIERGRPPDATYRFKHALVRDAAYSTLLHRRRQELHACIGEMFETRFSEIAESEPDLLAHHFTEARSFEKAITYWEKAGRLSARRSAMAEAAAHLQKGLELLVLLPETPGRRRWELALQIGLGSALIAACGYTSPVTGQVYQRAHAICEELSDAENLVRVVDGLWSFHAMRAETASGLRVGQEMLDRSADPRFAGVRLTAHRLLGASLLQVGRLAEAHTHFEAAERLLDESDQGGLGVERTARDGDLVGVPAYHSVVLALMGSYEAGRAKSAATLVASRRSFRPHRHAFALGMAGYWFHLVLNEDTQETTEEMAALAAEHEFPYWSAFISLFRGVSLAKLGKAKEGVALVREGIRQHELIGASFTHEVFLGMVAEFAPTEEAEGLIDLALSHVAATGALWFLPELHRIQATLLLREGDQAAAEKLFLRAIELAREQGARHWELRAAVRLADLWREQGKPSQAQHLLAPIYALFSPASEILDLTQARVLLEKLQKVAGSHRPLVHLAASAGAASS